MDLTASICGAAMAAARQAILLCKLDLLGLAVCCEMPQICDEQEQYDRAAFCNFICDMLTNS